MLHLALRRTFKVFPWVTWRLEDSVRAVSAATLCPSGLFSPVASGRSCTIPRSQPSVRGPCLESCIALAKAVPQTDAEGTLRLGSPRVSQFFCETTLKTNGLSGSDAFAAPSRDLSISCFLANGQLSARLRQLSQSVTPCPNSAHTEIRPRNFAVAVLFHFTSTSYATAPPPGFSLLLALPLPLPSRRAPLQSRPSRSFRKD